MKKDIAVIWAEALRSGRFNQGRYYLHREGKYCCLGVLCALAVENGVSVEVKPQDEVYCYDLDACHLPPQVQEWAGMKTNDGFVERIDDGYSLPMLNDILGHSFNEIAETILADYEEL